jgi:hypothetical protein
VNPTDLQRRLDAAALPTEEATSADWERNVVLVRSRTRHRRVRRSVVAGLGAAAAVVVAVTWHPPTDATRVVPAGPPRSSARLVDPESLQGAAQQCADRSKEPGAAVPLWGGRGDDVEAVLYRSVSGQLSFCSIVGGGVTAVGAVSPDGPLSQDSRTGEAPTRDFLMAGSLGDSSDLTLSAFGFVPPSVTQVLLQLPDGRDVRAELEGGRWWAVARADEYVELRQVSWRALDSSGATVLESGFP